MQERETITDGKTINQRINKKMSSLNKVQLLGNLCGDPEIRSIPSGAKVANFSIATNEKYKTKDGNQVDKTEFHRVVFWRGLAEICEKYVKKGDKIFIEGKLTTRKWENKEGVTLYTTEIMGDNLILLGNKGGNAGNSGGQPTSESHNVDNNIPDPEDDLPF